MSVPHSQDTRLLDATAVDPLLSLRGGIPAIADLAFASFSIDASRIEGRHLALLPTGSLELDLTDPAQRRLGDYELIELIGEGGMGVVYRARQHGLDRDVAVKLLAAGPWASREFIARFRLEAQNAARMQHPNIVAIYEVGSAEEMHFFSMRLVHGGSLAALLKREGRQPAQRSAELLRIVAEAVDYAHRLGVLHLDLKPANVLIDDNGVPHVADFGLARRLEAGLAADNQEVSGTPSYMAPEQAVAGAQRITPATDIWGLGAILYELVTGEPPFLGESPQATLNLVVRSEPPDPRHQVPEVPRDLGAIIGKCMTRDVARRYASGRALADDLAAFIEGREVHARPLNGAQRILRWARRQPYVAALGLLFGLSILAGVIGVTSQWRRAESNAASASERLWESRRDAALRLQLDGNGFEALAPLIANIDEQEQSGKTATTATIERREVASILDHGVVLLKRMHLDNAAKASPFAAELSPDGSRFALALTDLTVHWYRTDTLRELGHVDLLGLANSSDAPQPPILLRFVDNHRLRVTLDWIDFYTAPGESDTYLIDLDSGGLVSPPDEFANLSDATFSANGKYAVLRNRNQNIQFWQVDPWKPLSPIVDQGGEREVMIPSRDGSRLVAVGNGQQRLASYDPRTMAQIARVILPPTQGLSAWAESGDGKRFAFGDFQGRVFVVDMSTLQLRQLPTPTGREVTWIAFSEDDEWLAAVRWDGAAYAFDVVTGAPLNAGQMQHDFELRRVAISHRQRLLIASGLGKSGLWRLPPLGPTAIPASRIATSPMRAATAGPYSLGFCATTGLIITAETDGEIRLWRAPASPVVYAGTARLLAGTLEYDGRHVADVAYNKVRVVTPASGQATPWVELEQPLSFAELIDGGHTLITTSGTRMIIFDGETMKQRHAPIELGDSPMRLAATRGSGNVVLSFPERAGAGFSERLETIDLLNGQRHVSSNPLIVAGPLRQFDMSADGERLLTTGPAQAQTQVFDAHTLRPVGVYPHDPKMPVVWSAFAPAAHHISLMTRIDDPRALGGSALAWNPSSGKIQETHEVSGAWPIGIIMAGARPFVAAREFDIFDSGAPDERRLRPATREEPTAVLATSHDGRLVAHAYRYSVQLYDAASGIAAGPPLSADLLPMIDVIAQVAFAPDDTQLLARSIHGAWIVWPIGYDTRKVDDLQQDTALLNATAGAPLLAQQPVVTTHDPGAWRDPEQRPQPVAATLVHGEAIPARAAHVSPLMLDMSAAYTRAPSTVSNTLHALIPSMNLFPLGTVRIEGTDFDVRGIVQLGDKLVAEIDITKNLAGLAVPATPIAAFHVLMLDGSFGAEDSGEELIRLRLHYRDGSSADLPLRSGFELPSDSDQDEPVPLGWAWGDFQRLTGDLHQHLLSNPRLTNPHPERLVASIDLEDTGKRPSGHVFFAVTAEPVIALADSGMVRRNTTPTTASSTQPGRKP